MLRIDVITIFPELFEGFLEASILGNARREGRIAVGVRDLREWTTDRHRTVDDIPYGGGPGMVMKPEPFYEALEALDADRSFLTAGGVFTDDMIDAFIDLKMNEVTQVRMTTHPVEFDMYYSC